MSEGTHTHARSPYVAAPADGAWLESHGVGPFVTGASYVGPGTFIGALGFLIGAFLLLLERTRTTDPVLVSNP